MRLPFNVDLSKKIVAITGAGGVICSEFARALATCGARVALLDINFEAAKTGCRRDRAKCYSDSLRLSGQTEYYGCQGNNRGIFRKS